MVAASIWIGAWCTLLAGRAAAQLDRESVAPSRPIPAVGGHRLLSEELSRDVFNHLTELHVLLGSGSWEEAAQLISQLDMGNVRGVTSDRDDPSLLVSLRVGIRRALDSHPRLVEQLQQDHGDLARLRIEQAIQAGRRRAVWELAEQFHATAASRLALQWLGDQDLARGQAAPALRWYREAAAASALDDGLIARHNLAAALAGHGSTKTIGEPVQLGEVTITPAELDEITEQLSARHAGASASAASPFPGTAKVSRITTPVRRPLQMIIGREPGKEVLAGLRARRVDWTGRQLATTVADESLLVNNRFQLLVLDADTGQRRWASQPLHETMLRSQDWPLVPMAPLVLDGLVLARQLYADAPQLACWNLATGQLLWSGPADEQLPISDPFLLDQQLAVLVMPRQRSVDSPIQLVLLNPRTGQAAQSFPLLRVRDSWWQRLVCQVAASDDRFFAVLGGIALCSDSEGSVRWIRSSTSMPPDTDRSWITQQHQPPLLRDDQLILAQVGVQGVEAIDPLTGAGRWQTVVAGMQRVVGCVDRCVIVDSGTAISSLDISSGGWNWQHQDPDLIWAAVCDENREIVYTRSGKIGDSDTRRQVEFVWLEASTGRLIRTAKVEGLVGHRPNIGPLAVAQNRTWMFFSDGVPNGQRELVQVQADEVQPQSRLP